MEPKCTKVDGEELMDSSVLGVDAETGLAVTKRIKLMLYCDICDAECSSYEVYQQHLAGVKHFKQLRKKLKLTDSSSDTSQDTKGHDGSNKTFTCNMCNVVLNSIQQMKCHQEGSKHRAKSRNLAMQQKLAALDSSTNHGHSQSDNVTNTESISIEGKHSNEMNNSGTPAHLLITSKGLLGVNDPSVECDMCGSKFSSNAQHLLHRLERHEKFNAVSCNST